MQCLRMQAGGELAAVQKALLGHLAALQEEGNAAVDPALLRQLLDGLARLQQGGCGAAMRLVSNRHTTCCLS